MLKDIRKILCVRNDRFGEFLLNIPAFRALKEAYPHAQLTLAVKSGVQPLAECIEYADKVAVWDDDFRKNLRKEGFDACVILNPTKEAHWAAFFAGIPARVGYDRKWGILLNYKIADNKNLALRHEVEYNLDLVSLIGARTNNKAVSLKRLPKHNNLEYVTAVAIHPYTSDKVKEWPVERFRELAQRIAGEFKLRVIMVGAADTGAGLFSNLGGNIINLVNKTSLVDLAQVLKQCRMLVSCDSGPVHLAAAVGTPVLALFRNDLPGKTAKRWGPWGKGHSVIEKNNLLDITVEEVLGQVRSALK
ncbi:MAG: glycosyltransferase family 9 protein [Candidatus Omnitrophica bacterium]|nr:glycosyltransferase family 9 protein [Candidatus Omnitrophota bacterium]